MHLHALDGVWRSYRLFRTEADVCKIYKRGFLAARPSMSGHPFLYSMGRNNRLCVYTSTMHLKRR